MTYNKLHVREVQFDVLTYVQTHNNHDHDHDQDNEQIHCLPQITLHPIEKPLSPPFPQLRQLLICFHLLKSNFGFHRIFITGIIYSMYSFLGGCLAYFNIIIFQYIHLDKLQIKAPIYIHRHVFLFFYSFVLGFCFLGGVFCFCVVLEIEPL